jgi:hypothetical protein
VQLYPLDAVDPEVSDPRDVPVVAEFQELVDALRRVANLALWCCLPDAPEPNPIVVVDDDHHV